MAGSAHSHAPGTSKLSLELLSAFNELRDQMDSLVDHACTNLSTDMSNGGHQALKNVRLVSDLLDCMLPHELVALLVSDLDFYLKA
jgi:hypothetical protein